MDANDQTALQQASDDLMWLADRMKGLMAFADALKKLGSIEKLTAETQERLDYVTANEARIRQNLTVQAVIETDAAIKERLADAKAEAEKIVQRAHEQATDIGLAARGRADTIIADAQSKGADIEAKLARAHRALTEAV
jgi:cell division septum initiation protein DivIVA